MSSLFLRFKNLLYFSLFLLPHSVSFCLANSCTTSDFFQGSECIYIYIILYYIHICCLYSGLFSLILRLTSMITLILFFIFCCFLRCAYVMFFFVHLSIILFMSSFSLLSFLDLHDYQFLGVFIPSVVVVAFSFARSRFVWLGLLFCWLISGGASVIL